MAVFFNGIDVADNPLPKVSGILVFGLAISVVHQGSHGLIDQWGTFSRMNLTTLTDSYSLMLASSFLASSILFSELRGVVFQKFLTPFFQVGYWFYVGLVANKLFQIILGNKSFSGLLVLFIILSPFLIESIRQSIAHRKATEQKREEISSNA